MAPKKWWKWYGISRNSCITLWITKNHWKHLKHLKVWILWYMNHIAKQFVSIHKGWKHTCSMRIALFLNMYTTGMPYMFPNKCNDAKSWLTGKTLMLGKTEGRRRWWQDEMAGWHHWLNGHEFEQILGDSEGQGSWACCSLWGLIVLDMTEELNNNEGSQHISVNFNKVNYCNTFVRWMHLTNKTTGKKPLTKAYAGWFHFYKVYKQKNYNLGW